MARPVPMLSGSIRQLNLRQLPGFVVRSLLVPSVALSLHSFEPKLGNPPRIQESDRRHARTAWIVSCNTPPSDSSRAATLGMARCATPFGTQLQEPRPMGPLLPSCLARTRHLSSGGSGFRSKIGDTSKTTGPAWGISCLMQQVAESHEPDCTSERS